MNVQRIDPNIPDFQQKTAGAAAFDLYACPNLDPDEGWLIPSGQSAKISCGIALEIPEGHFGLVTLRGGHGIRDGLLIHVGVIDSDYRGEIFVRLHNPWTSDGSAVVIKPYERFAQITIIPYTQMPITYGALSTTERGEQWGGSTGR